VFLKLKIGAIHQDDPSISLIAKEAPMRSKKNNETRKKDLYFVGSKRTQ
jgi:hypothetical protein